MMTPPRHRTNSRNRTLALAGGLVALGGLGWLVYTSVFGGHDGDAPSGSSSSNAEAAKNANRKHGSLPSLSLSLPPTFQQTPANLSLLRTLLTLLSERFIITLIVPLPRSAATTDHSTDLGSVARLSDTLRHIPHFDPRRLLEYSKEDGRLALVRALACDAHCEVMLQACGELTDDLGVRESDHAALFDDDYDEEEEAETEDGDKTPRAASPAPMSRQPNGTEQQEEHITSALERYHAEVARIRKSGSLLLFLVLPVGGRRGATRRRIQQANGGDASLATADIWQQDVEVVLKPFVIPGQLSSRLSGIKIVDSRLAIASGSATASLPRRQRQASSNDLASSAAVPTSKAITRAWTDAAKRLCHLADGWS